VKTKMTLALAVVAGSSVALAAPRESVSLTGVQSNGRINTAFNEVRTHTFTGSDAGGPYTATYLTFSGQQTDLIGLHQHQESMVLITPPSGTPFVARPMTISGSISAISTNPIPAGAFCVPVSSFGTAGTWTFRFFEGFDDGFTSTGTATGNLPDATWDKILITLNDDPAPTGSNPGSGPNYTFNFVDIDGVSSAPVTFTWTAAPGTSVGIMRMSGVATKRTFSPTVNSRISAMQNMRLRLTAPDGTQSALFAPIGFDPSGTSSQSSRTFSFDVPFPTSPDSGGTWTLTSFMISDVPGAIDITLPSVTFSPVTYPAPTATTLPLVDGQWSSLSTSVTQSSVVWHRLDVPQRIAASEFRALDIDHEDSVFTNAGTGTTSPQRSDMVLFNSAGGLVAQDSNEGSDSLAQLTFGRGTRDAEGSDFGGTTSNPYDGRDGTLPAGTYYLASTTNDTGGIPTTPFIVQSPTGTTWNLSGTLNVRARYLSQFGSPPPAVATQIPLTAGVWNTASAPINDGQVTWFYFDLPALTATGALDIDTEGTVLGGNNNVSIGLYREATGQPVAFDNEDGTGYNAALSFGANSATRSQPSGTRFNGRDGATSVLGTPGRIYVAMIGGEAIAGTFAGQYNVTANTSPSGTGALRVRYYATSAPTEAPATAIPMSVDTSGNWATASLTTTGPNDIAWFSFTAPATLTAASALDIDTVGSDVGDTLVALFNSAGTMVDSDGADGPGDNGQLSYGIGFRQRAGDGVAYAGGDGAIGATQTTTGIVPGGLYYVAVSPSNNINFSGTPWNHTNLIASSTGGLEFGTLAARVRSFVTAPDEMNPTIMPVVPNGQWSTATSAINNPGDVAWFRFTTTNITSTGAVDIDTFGTSLSPLNDTDIGLYNSVGAFIGFASQNQNDGPGLLSLLSYGGGNREGATIESARFRGQSGAIPAAVAPNSTYFLAVAGGDAATHASTFATNSPTINTGSVTARVRMFESAAPIDPAVSPVGEQVTLVTNGEVSRTATVGDSEIKWYVFSTPEVSLFTNRALQIDNESENTITSPQVDNTFMSMYRSDGTFRTGDTAEGSFGRAQLTFGLDNRPGVGPVGNQSNQYDGRDGLLEAGTYFLGVVSGDALQARNFFELSGLTPGQTGTIVTNWRLFDPSLPPATPPASTDLGVIRTFTPGTENVITQNTNIASGTELNWFRFTTPGAVTATNGFYLDIDTEGTDPTDAFPDVGTLKDTSMVIYSSGGFRITGDEDGGSATRSALSFGSTTPVRPEIITGNSGFPDPRNGNDGRLPAGTYYLALGQGVSFSNGGIIAFPTDFNVIPATAGAANSGIRVLNFRTNLVPVCGLSDIAGSGQSVGPDGQLTADDIILFINWFFAADLRADIAGSGQTLIPDGNFTADDLIVFINRFFAGC
jgi:hypothetical protein